MKIYNSMTRQKEEFIPLDGKNVKMYACGITVYDLSHIGHARQAIVYSMIADYMKYRGYNVKYVRNYTDVDDKIISRANAFGKNALEFSKEQILETETDMKNLHVTDADANAKASENIENIINFVKGLIDKGYAYPLSIRPFTKLIIFSIFSDALALTSASVTCKLPISISVSLICSFENSRASFPIKFALAIILSSTSV